MKTTLIALPVTTMRASLVPALWLASAIALQACAGNPTPDKGSVLATPTDLDDRRTPTLPVPSAITAPPSEVRDVTLPAAWATATRTEFASSIAAWSRDESVKRLDDQALAVLARALGESNEISVRAAVILGNTRDARAGDVLLARLEARTPEGARSLAGDIVAAAAFSSSANARDAAVRLANLATGSTAHPVLDVRVECALASLHLGRDTAIPFLLDLLREGTTTAVAKPTWRRIDWDSQRCQDLQDRAAEALSARAGIECAFKAGAPLAVREHEIERLARLVQSAPAQK